jgi:hypothetical protein
LNLCNGLSSWPDFKVQLENLCSVLSSKHTRTRFISECLKEKHAAPYISKFEVFSVSLAEWRWGAVLEACSAVKSRMVPSRMFWSTDKMIGGKPGVAGDDEDGAEDAEGTRDLPGKRTSHLQKAGDAVGSSRFWAYCGMVTRLNSALNKVEMWFKSCECHVVESGAFTTSAAGLLLPASFSCPNIGRKFHLLAAGLWRVAVKSIIDTEFNEILVELVELDADLRSKMAKDWARGKDRVIAILSVKFR